MTTNDYTLTPNPKLPGSDIGWNCTSADGKIEVYGETKAEAVANMEVAQLTQQLAAEKQHSTTWRHHARTWRHIARAYYADHKPDTKSFGILDSCPCDVCARYRAFVESPEAAKRAALALGGESHKEGAQ